MIVLEKYGMTIIVKRSVRMDTPNNNEATNTDETIRLRGGEEERNFRNFKDVCGMNGLEK